MGVEFSAFWLSMCLRPLQAKAAFARPLALRKLIFIAIMKFTKK